MLSSVYKVAAAEARILTRAKILEKVIILGNLVLGLGHGLRVRVGNAVRSDVLK